MCIRDSTNRCHLLLVGDGPARASLEERARSRNVEAHLTITGVVPRDKVGEYVAAFDIALQPAVVSYASPLKLFEYMAFGCAILAPATPNILEVLRDGENAVLFKPDDLLSFATAMEKVCKDVALRDRIGKAARATICEKSLTWENNAKRVLELFWQLGVGGKSAAESNVATESKSEHANHSAI